MTRPVIFLDDGGVMNENERRGPQWQRLVGVFLAPRLGGSQAAWARANVVAAEGLFADYARQSDRDPDYDVDAMREVWNDRWLVEMSREVGVAPPPARADRLRLVDEANAFITRNVRAAYPGVVKAIEQLARAGYVLNTASGEHSSELDGYLTGMGARHHFGTLYGPNLVRAAKAGPRYYAGIFAHANLPPSDALVVDDSEAALDWAASVGAQTVLCRPEPPRSSRHQQIASLAELPSLLDGSHRMGAV